MSKNLFLHHKFTDRGGFEVYDAFAADDRLELKNRLFEIRIKLNDDSALKEITVIPGPSKIEGHGTG